MPLNFDDFKFSGRLFFRFYLLLVLGIVLIGSLIEYLHNRRVHSSWNAQMHALYAPHFIAIGAAIQDTPADARSDRVAELAALSGLRMRAHDLSDFAGDVDTLNALQQGQMVSLYDADDRLTLYQRLINSALVLSVQPDLGDVLNQQNRPLVIFFYALMAVIVLLLLWPLSNQLLKIKTATRQIGRGDFSTRIHVNERSALAPVELKFNEMAGRIEQLMLSQRALINSVSHELRTPLARLKFRLEDIAAQLGAGQLAEAFKHIEQDVTELEQLTDEMLSYAEITQSDRMQKHTHPVAALIDEVIRAHPNPDVQIHVEAGPGIDDDTALLCNRLHLQRALGNVLRNALRHARSLIQVRFQRNGDWLEVDICDDGPGIDASIRDRIFQAFVKSSRPGSTQYGLGLAIARNIAEKHGGELILAAEDPCPGAAFRFRLPLTTH